MTVKQLIRKLQQEKYDLERFNIVVSTGDEVFPVTGDEVFPVTGIELDEEKRQLRFSLDDDEEAVKRSN
jgi:hypothetical protein